jgi:hypothetical protein
MAPTKLEEGASAWPQLGNSQLQGSLALTPQDGQGRSRNAMESLVDGDDTPGTTGEADCRPTSLHYLRLSTVTTQKC